MSNPNGFWKLALFLLLMVGLVICCGNFYKFGDIRILTIPMDSADLDECELRLEAAKKSLGNSGRTILYSNIVQELRTGKVFGIVVYK